MCSRLSSLLPLGVDTDDATQGTSETDNAVIEEGNPSETGDRNEDIAKVAEELLLGGSALTEAYVSTKDRKANERMWNLHGNGLALDNTLTLLQVNL